VRTAYSSVCEWGTATSQWVRDRRDLRNSRWAWLVLTNSGYSRDTYMNRYRRAASVCTYGVDAERFRPLGIPREDLVLSVGRLVEPKQHHQVIEAIGHLPVGERPRLTIATPEWKNRLEDPFYHDHLRQSAADRGVDLEILHDPPQDELVRLYNRARAVVFVPRMEPFGLVALEGMACGTPVIGVSEGGVRESVRDGVTGFLVPRDPQAIAARIALLFKQPATQQQMGVDAARYVREEWTWSRTIDQYEEHTNHLLQSGKVP